MNTFLLIIIGILGGVIGGMGMGGGTFLIPLLTIFCSIEQHIAQSVNLIAFVPMSMVAIFIHAKNKLIDFKVVPLIAISAVASSIPASILAKNTKAELLSIYFGIFLCLLGIYQLVTAIMLIKNSKKGNKKEKSTK